MVHDLKTLDIKMVCDAHAHVSYSGTLVVMPVIDYNSLIKKLQKSIQDLNVLQKYSKESMELTSDLVTYKTLSWLDAQKVEEINQENGEVHISNTKKGCGRLADAMILANAVRGMSITEIQSQYYPYKKDNSEEDNSEEDKARNKARKILYKNILYKTKKVSRRKVFDALSVNKPDDSDRIDSLFDDFPEVFKDIDREQISCWADKKANKGGRK